MLNLRLARSPLCRAANQAILNEYNRLTLARIPIEEFEHWVQDGPAGPAWHAILETDEGRIVGHTSLFPLRTSYPDPLLIPAKSEFSVLHEDFRSLKIRGFEKVSRPAFIILLDHLFKHCLAEGWGPLFASTNEKNQVFTRKVGLRPTELSLTECLLVLRPASAARETPNIDSQKRALLFAAGLAQGPLWSAVSGVLGHPGGIRSVPIDATALESDEGRLSFFEDQASLRWRYLADQYVRLSLNAAPADYLIAKRGSKDRFLRVCQWRLSSARSVPSLIVALVQQARADGAIGVRWAIYEDGAASEKLVGQMKMLGFLCARRTRIVMVHDKHPQFRDPAAWVMSDSLFSFDP